MRSVCLKTIDRSQAVGRSPSSVDEDASAAARGIVEDVARRGEAAVLDYARRFGDLEPGGKLFYDRRELAAAAAGLPGEDLAILERTAARIGVFAAAQMASMREMEIRVPGGMAGHTIAPVERAGCYAPGGRFPLPSSVLMTAVTARSAGVKEIWVASPRPRAVTLAAAAVAGAEGLLAVGGAQGIAAMTFGLGPMPPCDAVVGPGNRFVTAAKQLVAGRVAIDMLAGPSELVILADGSAAPALVAADLLAQAEHDVDAAPILVTTSASLVRAVNERLEAQLERLPTADVARAALDNGFAVVVGGIEEGLEVCDEIAPEHLELMVEGAPALAPRCGNYGGLFIGSGSAEVLGDYGAGPNHTLPTGGTARSFGGLSVLTFLRVRTWLRMDPGGAAAELIGDAARLARMEGLEAHARALEMRAGGR